jgi:DNA-binding transcriptional ArsR family regulator
LAFAADAGAFAALGGEEVGGGRWHCASAGVAAAGGVQDRHPDPGPRDQALTCDHLVTYFCGVTDGDLVFKALADPSRRFLLDLLFARDGRTLTELESELEMTRFGVMKHLRVLEDAGLVVTRRSGREKLHFLNPVPIRLIHDRWIDKYTERQASALVELKAELEKTDE